MNKHYLQQMKKASTFCTSELLITDIVITEGAAVIERKEGKGIEIDGMDSFLFKYG